jgi:ELWxxDGT repeat protein
MPLTVFAAASATNDVELFGTDGTTGRTALIKNINGSGSGQVSNVRVGSGSSPLPFAVVGNFAYFSATDGSTGQELWRTDGTLAGTTKVTEFSTTNGTADPNDDTTGFSPQNIVAANNFIFFYGTGPAAASPANSPPRNGIWKYDPVANTTTLITEDAGINNLIASTNGRIYWTFDSASSGMKSSDGVGAVETHFSLGVNGAPAALYDVAGNVYLAYNGGTKKVTGVTEFSVTGGPAQPSGFIATSTHVYIIGGSTNELWVTTTASTTATQLTAAGLSFDFQNGGAGAHVPGFAALGNLLIFSNNKTNAGVGANTGSEVWVSDGSSAGTQLLKDIVPGIASSNPHNFITVGGSVYFQATNGVGSVELWKTDGTGAGTVLVETIFAGGFSPSGGIINNLNLENLSVSNGLLYFTFDDQVHGSELWRSDGTAAGTLMFKDLNTTLTDSSFQILNPNGGANFGTTGVFTGWTLQNGYELFLTNGTQAGTALLKDIDPGGGSSVPQQFVLAGPRAFFTAYSPTFGVELWVTDGTAGNTFIVKDISPVTLSNTPPSGMTAIGNNIYFSANDGVNGNELWFSDGTVAGTFMVKDINTGVSFGAPRDSNPGGFVAAGGLVFFTATTAADGRELWVTDGTPGGTVITRNIATGAADPNIQGQLLSFNGKVYFTAQDSGAASKGAELYVSDGTSGGTVIVKDLNVNPNGTGGTDGSNPLDLLVANGLIIFRASGANPGIGQEVYASTGAVGNATPVTATLQSFSQLVTAGNKVFFTATGANGQELYVTNGVTTTLLDIVPGVNGSNAQSPVAFGTKVLFTAQDTATNGTELWISDGGPVGVGPTGTFLLKNINPNAGGSSFPQNFVIVGSKAYFVADNGSQGRELWVTDGTTAGTQIVQNIGPGAADGSVQPLRAVDNTHLLFSANDGVHGQELWITDGTTTFRFTDVVLSGSSIPAGAGPAGLNGGGALTGNFASVPFTLPAGATAETFNGTADPDYFEGLGGNDVINGLGGDDTLLGGDGNDVLDGGSGSDVMSGGNNDDVYVVDNAGDVVVEGAGGGFDTVYTSVSYTIGANVERLGVNGFTTTFAVNLTGNSLANEMIGNDGANVIDGAGGADLMKGLGGDDFYVVDNSSDQVVELTGGGFDTVFTSINLTIGANVERLFVNGASTTFAVNLTGNDGANEMVGNDGANIINGGGGADLLKGLGGDDIYVVDNIGDQVVEQSGAGLDTVFSSITFTIGSNVERLFVNGATTTFAVNLTGNELGNEIVGNNGANILDGGTNADVLKGLGGDDFYIVDNAGDQVVELAGDGFDTVYTLVSYTLGANVERVGVNGFTTIFAINLTGNGANNEVLGNDGVNILDGAGGADIMTGFGGNDVYIVDNVGDSVNEGFAGGTDIIYTSVNFTLVGDVERLAAIDPSAATALALIGNAGANEITGNNGGNTINGGFGADVLIGGGGADAFFFTTSLGGGNIDQILDFQTGLDKLALDDAVFAGLPTGALAAGAFRVGTGALDADDRIIYDPATGALLFDADGAGGAAAVQFATLSSGLGLSSGDFLVV